MSLLQQIPFSEYKKVIGALTTEQCEVVAKLAHLDIHFDQAKIPGEELLKSLDRNGCTVQKYREFLNKALSTKLIRTYYRPETKVAILIANEKYHHLSKLVTPSIDCDLLASSFKHLGFIVVTIKNTTSNDLKEILAKVFDLIPENSYCFVFYAGHGCELCNTKCMLGIDCPAEDIQLSHCITENYVLREANKCKPDLSVLIMDMCRLCLNRGANPQIFSAISDVEEYSIHKNSLIAYSTQSSQAAYEVLQIECSHTIDNNVTYELKPGDTDKIVPRGSQYVNALCTRLEDGLDVSALLDKVHEDVENSMKRQRPIKLQCGVAKRSLYDPARGDVEDVLNKIQELCKAYEGYCSVF
ncbi:hypothetical protein MSG28_012702 [Choristoneura fumiferana]|uniref:Uncharacterized protein n=1 Tax=Choristoneura fumiferana TaxID=7141 RepID=A0ACC0JHQ4_CHOFU|nr:hypothetical protein MSG28_012702 [Choristoneura fumiferana]